MQVKHSPLVALIAVAIALSVTGCGGSDASTGNSSSPFTGNYSGAFSDAPSGQTGTYTLVVNTQGGLYGTVHNTTTATFGQVNGSIDASGNAILNITYVQTTTTEHGVLSLAVNQHLTGTLTGAQTETVDLAPVVI